MIRKSVSIWFISIASFFLLAFTLLPHHHHHNDICFKSFSYEADKCGNCIDNDNHHHEIPNHKHETDDCQGFHFCLKEQFLLLPTNQFKLEAKEFSEHFPSNDLQVFDILISDQIIPLLLLPENKNGPSIAFSNMHIPDISGSNGLRAPPVS